MNDSARLNSLTEARKSFAAVKGKLSRRDQELLQEDILILDAVLAGLWDRTPDDEDEDDQADEPTQEVPAQQEVAKDGGRRRKA